MLTATEERIIEKMPPIYKEYLDARFKPKISVYSGEELYTLVKELIIDILFSSGVKDKNDQKVKDYLNKTLSEDLSRPKFASISFEEIELALKKGVRQEYGPYMGVNIQTIHSWIIAFLNSKDRELALKEFHSKVSELEYGKVDKMSPVNPEGQKKVSEMLRAIIKSVPQQEIESKQLLKKVTEKSERSKFIQSCFMEFDKLADKNPSVDHEGKVIPGRFIDHEITDVISRDSKGNPIYKTHVRPIDITDYLGIRIKEYDLSFNQL